ncbi:hypothetical protein [Roseovarius sp. M141]|uniref:hypothetical protein n=1 Tax=Roseovarius sp. M141 TaxID=2583806 RepID=UPI0020CECF67|nr:hypothetical protein [Roseovarius sp. M141]MCQ0093388.1 hypothetical protein [Roseovarius sp. M141]
MVIMNKPDDLNIYLSDQGPDGGGVAFLPAVDTGATTLELSEADTQTGFFAAWTGQVDPQSVETLLGETRERVVDGRRAFFQFLTPGIKDPGLVLHAVGDTAEQEEITPNQNQGLDIPRVLELSLKASKISLANNVLTLTPLDTSRFHLLSKVDNFLLTGFGICLEGTLAGCFKGDFQVQRGELRRNGFVVSMATKGKKFFDPDDPFGGSGFLIEKDERQIVVDGADGAGVALTLFMDPLAALNLKRTFFAIPEGKPVLSALGTTKGHNVILSAKRPAHINGGEIPPEHLPRFSIVQERSGMNNDDSVVRKNVTLVLEGDFDIKLVDERLRHSLVDSDAVPDEIGIVIGDSPHEYLAAPPVTPLDEDSSLTLSLRRGPNFLGSSDPSAPFDITAESDDATADQTIYGKLSRGDVEGPVVSEARNVRRLNAEDSSNVRHDPFRLEPVGSAADTDKGVPPGMVPILPRADADAIKAPVSADGVLDAAEEETRTDADPTEALADALIDGEEAAVSIADMVARERRKLLKLREKTGGFSDGAADSADADIDEDNQPVRQTPLGFEIVQDGDFIKKVILARTPASAPRNGTLEIVPSEGKESIDSRFLNAIVRNQLFVVANRSGSATADFGLRGVLELSGWGFEINLWEGWKEEITGVPPIVPIVIIKGYEGRSISELMETPDQWSARDFLVTQNGGQTAEEYALSVFKESVEKANEKPNGADRPPEAFKKFREIVNDKTWNGVLVINVPIPSQVLPDEIKGLLGGMDMSKFRAHHIGIPVRQITGAKFSKAFAAINYEVGEGEEDTVSYNTELEHGDIPGPRLAHNGSDGGKLENGTFSERFAMRVKLLRVGFDAGKIQNFACKLDLKIGSFFHNKFGNDNDIRYKVIELDGRFRRDGEKVTYDFMAAPDFRIDENDLDVIPLIKSVYIERVSYTTTITKNDDGTETTDSRFDISGDVDFKKLGDIDVFGDGEISFRNLGIDMRFKLPKIGRVSWPSFRFSPGALLFDFHKVKSGGGDWNFWNSLPLKFTGFGWLGDVLTLPKLGFLSLGRTGGDNDSEGAPFFLKFDLDLGSLGSFASRLADFKMELGLVFGLDKKSRPSWDFGFRFAGAGGTGLEIGLQGFLKLACDRYKLVRLEYDDEGETKTYWAFMGLNARLYVFGNRIPPEDKDNPNRAASIYLFVDPEKLEGEKEIGWLLATTEQFDSELLKVPTFALGQRIKPFELPANERIQTRDVLEKFNTLTLGMPNEAKGADPDVVPNFPEDIRYAPDYGWTIGFKGIFYDLVHIGFVSVDPELAGILLDVKLSEGSSDSLFSVDVLYRKLADDLGVYAIEIELPPSLRNWQFGAVGITIPVIGVEIFTDGNWGVDIGYPHDKDFQRSFAVNVFPFVGAGGFFYRRVAGPASRLVPQAAKAIDGTLIRYDPVTEVGMGMRVGLGVTLAQGVLNAGLSVTVYGYLVGAYGKLNNPNNLPTPAKRSYITVWGAVGIMGELYGYVDFGIVKAGVFVQLYVEVGLRFETDRATELYLEVGVRVRVRVVIGSFKVFGKRIEIAITFSFATKVRFSRFIGSNKNQEYYVRTNLAPLDGLDQERPDVVPLRPATTWMNAPAPSDWSEIEGKIPLSVVLQPDLTVAPAAADGTLEVHAVYSMAATINADIDMPIERLVQALTAWAICAGLEIEPEDLKTLAIRPEELNIVAERLATPGRSGPSYDQIVAFLKDHFPGTVEEPAENLEQLGQNAPRAALMPMPEGVVFRRVFKTTDEEGKVVEEARDHRPSDFDFVDNEYRSLLETGISRFMHDQRTRSPSALDSDTKESLARVLTEEWVEMIMRAGTAELVDRLTDGLEDADDEDQSNEVSDVYMGAADLIGTLLSPSRWADDAEGDAASSAAEEIAVTAGRFFAYGQRLPEPTDPADLPEGQEKTPDGRDGSSVPEDRFFHAIHRLGGMQFALGDAIRLEIPEGTYDSWLDVPAGIDTGSENDISSADVQAFANAARGWTEGSKPGLAVGEFFDSKPHRISLGIMRMASNLDQAVYDGDDPEQISHFDPKKKIWLLNNDARKALIEQDGAPDIRIASPRNGAARTFDKVATGLHPTIVLDVAIRRPNAKRFDGAGLETDPASTQNAFEIAALPEPERRLLDVFAPAAHQENATEPPNIAGIRIYVPTKEGYRALNDGGKGEALTIVQSNLSTEIAPSGGILDTDEAPKRIAPVADRKADAVGFLQLLRQATLVNTGGYTLSYPNAEADLAELVDAAGQGDPVNAAARIRIVVALKDARDGLRYSNALLSDDKLGQDISVAPTAVVGLSAGQTRAPLHDPGVIPIRVTRAAPEDDEVHAVAIQVQERFTNLALEASVLKKNEDGDWEEIGKRQFSDQSIATGPDFVDPVDATEQAPEETEDGDKDKKSKPRIYRVAIPAAGIAFGPKAADRAYELVGCKVAVDGVWRDIYGNSFPAARNPIEIDVHYSDRLTGLGGLPHQRLSYWPMPDRRIRVGMESRFDALTELDLPEDMGGEGDPIPQTWLRQKVRDLERDMALIKRARLQLLDKGVTVALTCPLGTVELSKSRLADHILEVLDQLNQVSDVFKGGLPEGGDKRGAIRGKLYDFVRPPKDDERKPPQLWLFWDETAAFTETPVGNFTEFDVTLRVYRPDPLEAPDLYDDGVLLPVNEDGQRLPDPDLSEIWTHEQILSSNVIGDANNVQPEDIEGFGGTTEGLLQALAKCATEHRIATGYSEKEVSTERAIWLIRNSYIDMVSSAQINLQKPLAYAFPPLRNAPLSYEFKLVRRGVPEVEKRGIIDADADAYGRVALERLEHLLSPALTVPLLNANGGDAAKRQALTAAIGDLMNAKDALAGELSRRLSLVFKDDTMPADSTRTGRLLNHAKDRLRRDLRNHYRTTAFLGYFAENSEGVPGEIPVAHGKLLSQGVEESKIIRMTPFNLPLAPDDTRISNDLFVSCEIPPYKNDHSYPTPTHLELTHVQRKERPDVGAGGASYREAAWLQLYAPDTDRWTKIDLPVSEDSFVPNILRGLPRTPRIEEEWFEPSVGTLDKNEISVSIRRARQWQSYREIQWETDATDLLEVKVEYRTAPARVEGDSDGDPTLMLMTFVLETDPEMTAIVERLDADAFIWVAGRFKAYQRGGGLPIDAIDAESPIGDSAVFQEKGDTEEPAEFRADWVELASPPLLVDHKEKEGVFPDLEGRSMSYGIRKRSNQTGKEDRTNKFVITGSFEEEKFEEVPGATAKEGLDKRVVGTHGLDILTHLEAKTMLLHTRNRLIRKREPQDVFVYNLPAVVSGEPVRPVIDRSEIVDGGTIYFRDWAVVQEPLDGAEESSLQRVLLDFVNALMGDVSAQQVGTTRADIVFEYESGLYTAEDGGAIIHLEVSYERPVKPTEADFDDMAAKVGNWLNNQPSYTADRVPRGALVADARVYLVDDEDRMALRLRRVRFGFIDVS